MLVRIETGLLHGLPCKARPYPALQSLRKEFQQVLRGRPARLPQISVRGAIMIEDIVVLIDGHGGRA